MTAVFLRKLSWVDLSTLLHISEELMQINFAKLDRSLISGLITIARFSVHR